MKNFTEGNQTPEQVAERRQLTRGEVAEMLSRGESLERVKLTDLDLTGLALEGRSFRGADIRGIRLYDEENPDTRTVIRDSDWTDAEIGDFGDETIFAFVDATGATFGFSESLVARRARHARAGDKPKANDSGAIFNFNGSNADFIRTVWKHVDFAGDSGYEAIFAGADLSGAEFDGSDLHAVDFSQSKLEGVRIKDPVSLQGMRIRAEDAESVAMGITLSDTDDQPLFAALLAEKGAVDALAEAFGVIVE